jgi:TolB-like protein
VGAPFSSLVLLSAFLLGSAPPSVARADGPKAPTLAILYFDYSGKDEEMGLLRKGLAQMLISDLSGAEGVRLVERERLEDVLAELKLGQKAAIDPKTAAKVGKLLGAQHMVLGSYFALGGILRADARIVEVETGRVLRSAGANGKPDDFLGVEQRLKGALQEFIAAGLPASPAPAAPGKGGDGSPDSGGPRHARVIPPAQLRTRTALRYGKALEALDRGKKEEAKAELQSVLKEQPDFELAALDLDKLMK